MKFCDAHWKELRSEVESRGLGRLVAPDGPEAIRRLEAREFDPLMHAHMLITRNALDIVGLDLLAMDEKGGHRCPVCYLVTVCGCVERGLETRCAILDWPKKAADAALEVAGKLGLIASA